MAERVVVLGWRRYKRTCDQNNEKYLRKDLTAVVVFAVAACLWWLEARWDIPPKPGILRPEKKHKFQKFWESLH
jgi:hypothetical protein